MYFNERFNEKNEDALKDKLTFTHPWYITFPPPNVNFDSMSFKIRIKYKFHATTWFLYLERNRLRIVNTLQSDRTGAPIRAWNGTCFCSYNLYSDNEKRVLLYSSPRTKMRNSQTYDMFTSPAGFMTKYDESLNGKLAKTMDVFLELQLPVKHFYRPFEMSCSSLSKHLCEEYPTDLDKDFRFDFMNESDFVIKCPDGEMPAMRIILNNASEYMHGHFNTYPNSNELTVEHSIDVIKPIITCFHTRYFQMPKLYNLDYAERLLMARDFFHPHIEYHIKRSVHKSLCQKFVEENHTFNSILHWLEIAHHQSFYELEIMIATAISDKFYYEWNQTFPDNARDERNPIFRDIFGRRSTVETSTFVSLIFLMIHYNMVSSLITNVILD